MLQGRVTVPATNPIVWTYSEFRPVWIGGDMSRRQNNGTRTVASCELFMQHVPATLEKNKPIRRRHSSSQQPFKNLSPQRAHSCEQRMKFFPATWPCNMPPARGVLIIFLGGGVAPCPENTYPISDLTLKMYTLFQTLWCVAVSATLDRFTTYGTSWRPKRWCSCFFSSRSMSTATHITPKMVSQTKQTEYAPYFRPKRHIYTLFQTRNARKWYPLGRQIPIWPIYGCTTPPPPSPGVPSCVPASGAGDYQTHTSKPQRGCSLVFRFWPQRGPWEAWYKPFTTPSTIQKQRLQFWALELLFAWSRLSSTARLQSDTAYHEYFSGTTLLRHKNVKLYTCLRQRTLTLTSFWYSTPTKPPPLTSPGSYSPQWLTPQACFRGPVRSGLQLPPVRSGFRKNSSDKPLPAPPSNVISNSCSW